MSCSQAAAIKTGRSSTGTVTASSAARLATPWVCSHRSGKSLPSRTFARPRALAINIGEGSTTVIAPPHQGTRASLLTTFGQRTSPSFWSP